jgi:hypothetical protein
MSNLVEIVGGDGTPPEPNWRSIFGRANDRAAAAEYWRGIISEMRAAEKLAVVNAHSIKRLAERAQLAPALQKAAAFLNRMSRTSTRDLHPSVQQAVVAANALRTAGASIPGISGDMGRG